MAAELPWEVIQQILLELPLKSVARFECVSRLWRSNISELRRRTYPIFRHYSDSLQRHLLSAHRREGEYTRLHDPYNNKEDWYQYRRTIASSNGITCFYVDACRTKYMVSLWNPSLNRSLDVDLWDFRYLSDGHYCFGFGHHPEADDYLLVQLFSIDEGVSWRSKLYAHKANRREDIPLDHARLPHRILSVDWHSQSLEKEGRFHWLARCQDELGNKFRRVLWFDMRDKVFGQIALPKTLELLQEEEEVGHRYKRVDFSKFGNYKGRLTLFAYRYIKCGCECHIWVKSGSWKELGYRISLDQGSKVTGFLNNWTVLIGMKHSKIVSYNLKTKELNDFGIGSTLVGAYKENLQD